MHAKHQVYICNGLKVMAKVKVVHKQSNKQTNKQTDRQTNRQGKNNMPPRSYLGGIKTCLMKEQTVSSYKSFFYMFVMVHVFMVETVLEATKMLAVDVHQ